MTDRSLPLPADEILRRLWARTEVTESGCRIWLGSTSSSGYGQLRIGGRSAPLAATHRLSFQIHRGPIPEGLEVCHTCDNPPCWAPDHLFAGTHTDNLRDMQAKGRRRPDDVLPRGVAHHDAKLTDDLVREIRIKHQQGRGYRRLAVEYGVSRSSIVAVCKNKTWRHVT